jgi:hypothetical protein
MGKKGSGHFEIWAKSNPHGPAFWRQIPREDWMRNHEWREGQRHTFFNRKWKKRNNSVSNMGEVAQNNPKESRINTSWVK